MGAKYTVAEAVARGRAARCTLVEVAQLAGSTAKTPDGAWRWLRARAGSPDIPRHVVGDSRSVDVARALAEARLRDAHAVKEYRQARRDARAQARCIALGLLNRVDALAAYQAKVQRAWRGGYPSPAGGVSVTAVRAERPGLETRTERVWMDYSSRERHQVAQWSITLRVPDTMLARVARGVGTVEVGGLITLDVDARGRATWLQPGSGSTHRSAAMVESGWLVRGAHSTASRAHAVQVARAREESARAAERLRRETAEAHDRLEREWPALHEVGAPVAVLAAAHLEVTPEAVRMGGACAPGVDAFLRRYGADGTERVALGAVWLAAPDARPWLERAAARVLAA